MLLTLIADCLCLSILSTSIMEVKVMSAEVTEVTEVGAAADLEEVDGASQDKINLCREGRLQKGTSWKL